MSDSQPSLAQRLRDSRILLAPGVFDALSALVAERTGAEAVYLSGASIAYTRLGRPDIGLVSVSEVAATLGQICDRVAVPVIVDADTGFGNAINTGRTVREFERQGAAAIQLEDQTMPKRCGHLQGKTLVSCEEMCGKVRAAVDARHNEATQLVIRTDAIAVEGFDAALARADAYINAGADVLFVEAPRDVEQMHRIIEQLGTRVPLLANMVEGGQTPLQTAAELERIGFSLVIFPGGLVRALTPVMQHYFEVLLNDGSTNNLREQMFDFNALNQLLGTPELLQQAQGYAEQSDD